MSNEAITWAWRQTLTTMAEKLVLVRLADMADERFSCWPGQKRLADDSSCSEPTVRRALRGLEAKGLIYRERRSRDDGSRTSDRYVLPVRVHVEVRDECAPTDQSDRGGVNLNGAQPINLTGPTDQSDGGLPINLAGPTDQSDGALTIREPSEEPSDMRIADARAHQGELISVDSPTFEQFWEKYPRRVDRKRAQKAWETIAKRSPGVLDTVLAGVVALVQRVETEKTEQKHIPHPTTWLNNERWDVELDWAASQRPVRERPSWMPPSWATEQQPKSKPWEDPSTWR